MSKLSVISRSESQPKPSNGVQNALGQFGLSLEYDYVDKLPIEGVSLDSVATDIPDILNGFLFDIKPPSSLMFVASKPHGFWYFQGYGDDGWLQVEAPSNMTLILDTETLGLSDSRPMMAVAVSALGTYAYICKAHPNPHSMASRIPLGQGNIIAGWNISFDRAQMTSTFNAVDSNRYFDLMSIVAALYGYSNQQSGIVRKIKSGSSDFIPDWFNEVSGRSLKDSAEYFGLKVDKAQRDIIVEEGQRAFIGTTLVNTLYYCYDDVKLTAQLSRIVIAAALKEYNPIALKGLFLRNSELVCLSDDWTDYLERNEPEYLAVCERVSAFIMGKANELLKSGPKTKQHGELDWTLLKSGPNKGIPKWYRDISKNPSLGVGIVPYIIGLHYRGVPVFRGKDGKWYAGDDFVPHPETGLPISSAFVKGSRYEGEGLEDMLSDVESLTNWKSLRKQIASSTYVKGDDGNLWQCPRMVGWGTISRRKTDFWMQLPNPKPNRLGTEARMLIVAPKGKTLVTFDVDSEEALIAAIMGDAVGWQDMSLNIREPMPGSTALSLATMTGDKDAGTDIHTLASKKPGIERQSAKTLVYGALYGQGLKGTSDSLYKSGVPGKECEQKALEFVSGFKGVRRNGKYWGGLASYTFNALDSFGGSDAKTLIFKHGLPKCLRGNAEFMTTRKNWVIQGTGQDILDIIMVVFDDLATKEGIQYRFVLSHHDCISVTVDDNPDITARVAVLLQIAHATAWLCLLDNLGFDIIPVNILIASSVEVGRQYKHGNTPKYSVNHPVEVIKAPSISDMYWKHKQNNA